MSAKRNRAPAWRPPPWVAPVVVGAALVGFTVWAWPPRDAEQPRVRDGNRAWAQRDYPGALSHYEAAPGDGVRNAGVHMNRGLARYRIAVPPGDGGLPELAPDAAVPESWQRAQDEMRNAARGYAGAPADDIEHGLRARASYNLGNTYFTQRLWQSAIDAYKEALRLDPRLVDAAWNLELARRRKDEEDHPDAGPDAGNDASQDASPDASQDGGNRDGGNNQGDGGNSPNDGGNSPNDGGGAQPDASAPDASSQPDGGGGGNDGGANPQQPDAGAPPPMSLAPLDQLERNAQDLQQLLLRRRAAQMPRNPDDER